MRPGWTNTLNSPADNKEARRHSRCREGPPGLQLSGQPACNENWNRASALREPDLCRAIDLDYAAVLNDQLHHAETDALHRGFDGLRRKAGCAFGSRSGERSICHYCLTIVETDGALRNVRSTPPLPAAGPRGTPPVSYLLDQISRLLFITGFPRCQRGFARRFSGAHQQLAGAGLPRYREHSV